MKGYSDVLHGTKPPDKSSQQERILFSKDQLDSIVAKINCGVSEKPVSELNPARHIPDPINLNPAQSSQLLKEVMEGESNYNITSNPLGIEKFQPTSPEIISDTSKEPLVLPPKPVTDCLDRPESKDPFSFHKSLPLVIEKLLEKSSTPQQPKLFFQVTKDSAINNFKVLRDNNWNIEKVINSKEFSVTNYGSEFKTVDDLDHLLEFHPR